MSGGSYLSTRDSTMLQVDGILRLQAEKWGLEHDKKHSPEDWYGLLTDRVARSLDDPNQYLVIAAMAISAYEAREII